MKAVLLYAIILLFSFTSLVAQSVQKIYLSIENIPKIKHKVQTSKFSWLEEKSPTVTYQLENDATQYEIKYSSSSNSLQKEFDHEQMYLRLRYNPGKYQWYILRRGDSAFIEYDQGKPYLEITNRAVKKYDGTIQPLLQEFDIPKHGMMWVSEDGRFLKKEEREKASRRFVLGYAKQIQFLDSIYKEQLLSQEEYLFFRKTAVYKKMKLSKEYPKEVLREKDLHVQAFQDLISMYIQSSLKKKSISLGNGTALNWLEAFNKTKENSHLSISNRNHLLQKYLKGMKIDFPVNIYQKKRKEFESITSKKLDTPEDDALASMLETMHTFTNTVELIDASGIPTALSNLLERHKGKVVYIDFWASWCAPCRAAFPSYPELFKAYENKDVVFLFVSTDKDPDRWQTANAKEQLPNSYLATNYPEGELFQKLDMRSVPRYIIFGKDGKLVQPKAPGPDSDNIVAFINSFLTP